MTFQRKLFLSFWIALIGFIALLYFTSTFLIETLQRRSMRGETQALIDSLKKDTSSSLEEKLQHKKFPFIQTLLFNEERLVLFDNAPSSMYHNKVPLEVEEAFHKGKGYETRYNPLFEQEMAYSAVRFSYQDQNYVLDLAFPYQQISSLRQDVLWAFLLLCVCVLVLFGLFTSLIIYIFTLPVQQIIEAIKPYQLGKEEKISPIHLNHKIHANDEFGKLAETLNSLNQRIESQISSLTLAKNEKSAILESLIEGVIVIDTTMTVVYMNHMAAVFLATQPKALIGKSFTLAKQRQCEELIRRAQQKGEPCAMVLTPERKQKRFFDAIAIPREEGGAILVLQDKTGLHKVIELGRDFIANASHELKTPITIIRGFAETLHDHPELSKEMYQEVTSKIVSNCQRMDTLVKNLLTLAAVDEGLPLSRLQECDLVELANQAMQTILTVHPNADIRITTQGAPPFELFIDSDLFFQAILNLLDNAVKYSKPPAHVLIEIRNLGQEFVIKIQDRGIGIPAEDVDRIFERFFAVDKSHSRSLGGSGLGLSIVERIIEKHKGKIEVSSTLGKGTTFTITLPVLNPLTYSGG